VKYCEKHDRWHPVVCQACQMDELRKPFEKYAEEVLYKPSALAEEIKRKPKEK